MDVGKKHLFVVIRFSDGSFERPWKVKNPSELEFLVSLLVRLSRYQLLTVAIEPTGTYGDPLRAELAAAGLPVVRMSGKASNDYAETFDGVPSQHDGKDAAVVAELAAFGKAQPWPNRQLSEEDAANVSASISLAPSQQTVNGTADLGIIPIGVQGATLTIGTASMSLPAAVSSPLLAGANISGTLTVDWPAGGAATLAAVDVQLACDAPL